MLRATWFLAAAVVLLLALISSAAPQSPRAKATTRGSIIADPSAVGRSSPDQLGLEDGSMAEESVISRSLLEKVAVPPTRAQIVAALMRDTSSRSALQTLAQQHGLRCEQLATMTLSGEPVAPRSGDVGASPPDPTRTTHSPGVSPGPSGATALKPSSVASLDWASGIEFSPRTPGPQFVVGPMPFSPGALYVRGAELPWSMDLEDLYNTDTLVIGRPENRDRQVWLDVDLPTESATYLIAVRLAPIADSDASNLTSRLELRVQAAGGETDLSDRLTPLDDGAGVVFTVHMEPSSHLHQFGYGNEKGMLTVDARIKLRFETGCSVAFGGITISML